jgi:catechol 2,3-dioxygenase
VTIAPATGVGAVRLRVADLDRLVAFYERVIGLRRLAGDGDLVRLGVDGGPALVELVSAPAAPRAPLSPGLFHLAILVPTRVELARALRRVMGAGWRLSGASDHLVSEALYLSDPEGNGIELYRDRPREEWRSGPNGELAMATLPLDLKNVLGERVSPGPDGSGPMAAGTRVGHVHLQVSSLDSAERFYAGTLELDVTVRSYPGALFLSAGGYHHHIGVNTWRTEGARPRPEGALGLEDYELVLPDEAERDRLAGRLEAAGVETLELAAGVRAADPSGNRVLLTARA